MELFKMQDLEYRDFVARLIPTKNKNQIIGVRIPGIRKLAKKLDKKEIDDFLVKVNHKYHEENLLHGILIENMKDYDRVIDELNKFLPHVDNWSVCDSTNPKILKYNSEETLLWIKSLIKSDDIYAVRFGIKTLMNFYLDKNFKKEYLDMVANIESYDYYINMMQAWFFATALVKQYKDTIVYLEENKLDKWVHKATIQKALDSYRISDDIKERLRKLRNN